jgi:O-antigen/teichoic acid export membrane protein
LSSRRSLHANAVYQTVALAVGYAVSFIIAPILLARIGLEGFGIWALTGALAQYAGILDVGITRSLARFVALYRGASEDRVAQVIGLGLLVSVLVTAAMLVLAVGTAALFLRLFHIRMELATIRIILVSSVVMFGASMVSRVLAAFPTGLEDLVTPSIAIIVSAVVNLAASVPTLLLTRSLATYAVVSAGAACGGAIGTYLLIRLRVGPIPAAFPPRRLAGEVSRYAVKGQVPWVLDLANFQTDKVVIGAFVDVKAAAAYELVNRVSAATRQVGIVAMSPMLPRAVRLIRETGRQVISPIARHYSVLASSVLAPLFVASTLVGVPLMVAWLGHLPPDGLVILCGLNSAYLLNTLSGVLSVLAAADASLDLLVVPGVATTAINCVLTLALGPVIGVVGVLSGTVVALGLGSGLSLVMFGRRYGLSQIPVAVAVAKEVCLALLPAIPLFALGIFLGVPKTRAAGIGETLLLLVPYVLAYGLLARRRIAGAWATARGAEDARHPDCGERITSASLAGAAR